jgi:hypothetical protein
MRLCIDPVRVSFAIAAMLPLVFSSMLSTVTAREFTNLDFEQAAIPPVLPPGGFPLIDAELATPGWTVWGDAVLYNELTLGSPTVVLVGPDAPPFMPAVLQGSYSAILHYGHVNGPFLSQIGVVPADTLWMTFLASPHSRFHLTLDDVELPVFAIGGGRLAADVSVFAGQEVELKFATYFISSTEIEGLYFDDVVFTPTPEPSTVGFMLIGMGIFGVKRRRK